VTWSRARGKLALGAGVEARPLDRRKPSYESEPARNERVLFVLSLIGLLAAMVVLVAWAAH